MTIKNVDPYLNFNGTAAKAIALYEKALGAKTEQVMRFGDAPGMPIAPADKDRVMHAKLLIGPGVVMLSDTMANAPIGSDSNAHICLNFDDPADMAKKYDALVVGGKATMPINDTFWGAKFGMLTDAYGIRWMFNCETKKG